MKLQAERFGRLEVDHEVKLDGLNHWEIEGDCRVCAADSVAVIADGGMAIRIRRFAAYRTLAAR